MPVYYTYTESEFVTLIKQGDERGLSYFFNQHYKALCHFANGFTRDQEEAEDIVASCFVKLWERREKVASEQSVKAFLYISCRNACLDYLKKLRRRDGWQEDYIRQLESSDTDMMLQVVESAFLDVLDKEVAMLPDQCRKVFKMTYFEGKKSSEIAGLLDISVKTVRNHKARAIDLLRASFLRQGLSEAMLIALALFLQGRNP